MRRTSREGRIGFFCHKLKPLAKLYEMWIYLVHNSFIPAQCEIGEGTSFGYKGIGVVIHKRAKIGKNCVIAQGVTIGGRSGHYEVPVSAIIAISVQALRYLDLPRLEIL